MEACTPRLYLNNAFRIIGLPVDATQRDIRRRMEDLSAVKDTSGWILEHQHSLPFHKPPTPEDVRNALLRLQDPERRLIDEFFWFWPLNANGSNNDPALKLLQSGEHEKAYAIWRAEELTARRESTPAIHNLAVYHHLLAVESEWLILVGERPHDLLNIGDTGRNWNTAIGYWNKLSEQNETWDVVYSRVEYLADARISPEFVVQMQSAFPVAFDQINALLAAKYAEAGRAEDARRHIKYMAQSHQGLDDVDSTLTKICQPIENRLRLLIQHARDELHKAPDSGLKLADDLLTGASQPLDVVRKLLDGKHLLWQTLCDDVAGTALSCLIAYGNKTTYWGPCIVKLQYIEAMACSDAIKSNIRENRKIAEENEAEKKIRETCWFCKQRPGTTSGRLHTKMYGDVTRTPYYGGTHIAWRNVTIDVPRCDTCKEAHGKFGAALATGTAGAAVGTAVFPIVGSIVGFVVGAIIGSAIDKNLRLPDGVSSESTQKEFPPIKELRARGWTIGEKPT